MPNSTIGNVNHELLGILIDNTVNWDFYSTMDLPWPAARRAFKSGK